MNYRLRIASLLLAYLLCLAGCTVPGGEDPTASQVGSNTEAETPAESASESVSESESELETELVIPEDDKKTAELKAYYGPILEAITSVKWGAQPYSGPAIPADLGTGTTYYVSASEGSDSNDGKSEAKPFKSVNKLNSITLKPGDNILFKRGDVFEGQHLQPRGSGLAEDGKWITIDAYGEGANPRFEKPSQNFAAIFFADYSATRGYRIRHIDIDGYLQGICIQRGNTVPFEDLLIENCTISNITLNKDFEDSDRALLPIGAPLAFGIWIYHVKNVTVKNVSFYNTDCPVQSYGGSITFDGLDIFKANMQGMMLYGSIGDLPYEQVLAGYGNVTVQNTRIRQVGMNTGLWGSTGILMENLYDSTVKNVEISNLINGRGAFDGCAIDFEQSNINTVIDGAYLHDNQGPAFLLMEHGPSNGNSRGNVIRNVISVNNGRNGPAEIGTFMDLSSYKQEHQIVTLQNCIDIGYKGSVPLKCDEKLYASLSDAGNLTVKNVTLATLGDYEDFDLAENDYTVSDSLLQVEKDSLWLSDHIGRNYVTEAYLKGEAGLAFYCLDDANGYFWSLSAEGALLAEKVIEGKRETLKEITLPIYDKDSWVQLRVVINNGKINTYANGILIDSLEDSALEGGYCGIYGRGKGEADKFSVWAFAADQEEKTVTSSVPANILEGGHLAASNNWNSPEVNWKPENIENWLSRPYNVGWGKVTAKDATLTYENLTLKTKEYKKVQITLSNGTDSGKVWFEFSPDGKTWYGKAFDTHYRGSDPFWGFDSSMLRSYTLDLSNIPEWEGKITAIRLRFEGTSGTVGLKHIIIFK